MKQPLRIGDVIEVKAKDRRYSSMDYKIQITEITSRMAKGREVVEKDGTLSLFGINHCFNFNLKYDDKDNIAHIYGHDDVAFNCWDRKVIPVSKEKYTYNTMM